MRYAHIIARVTATPWFATAAAAQSIADILNARLAGTRFEMPLRPPDDDEDLPPSPPPPYEARPLGGVAIVTASGLLGKHLDAFEQSCGGCDYDTVVSSVRAAGADPSIAKIVLAIDSRGGTAIGAPEAHAALVEIKRECGKPLIGFCDTIACSAGYYLLAACDMIFCTTTANLGCIGAKLQIINATEADAKAGVKYLTIKSATMKDLGNPHREPTPDELSFLQSQIDYLGGLFSRDMRAARPTLAADVLETGLDYFGPEAVAKGLSDGVVASLDDLVASLAGAAI